MMAKRSLTGHHTLLPASGVRSATISFFSAPGNVIIWTFGRGTVLWRIWPAVLLHTLFAVAVTIISERTRVYLGIPNVLLTVLGVVIGFVISYRASSGYDRYWMGRTAWSDVIRNMRTLSRLIWFHVPLRLAPKSAPDASPSAQEIHDVMKEKRRALDMLEGMVIALKHHLRGEPGLYYEDLYHLTKPLHRHAHDHEEDFQTRGARTKSPTQQAPDTQASGSGSSQFLHAGANPVVPPINSYGSVEFLRGRTPSRSSTQSEDDQTPLLPSGRREMQSVWMKFSSDLVPFAHQVRSLLRLRPWQRTSVLDEDEDQDGVDKTPRSSMKHRPRVVCDGENLPLEIVFYLSNWFSALEDRGTVPGTSLGSMIGCLGAMEDSISTLERILTTPLPFVFSAHIRHTVWIYLFFLPFQLVEQFHWHTILGVAIASFIYLGFIAAGEEIEQPFGYDENDLDLDLFCREVIHTDLERLKRTPGLNVFLG